MLFVFWGRSDYLRRLQKNGIFTPQKDIELVQAEARPAASFPLRAMTRRNCRSAASPFGSRCRCTIRPIRIKKRNDFLIYGDPNGCLVYESGR